VPAGAGWLAAVLLVGQRPLAAVITAAAALTAACILSLILRTPGLANHLTSRRRVGWAVVGVLVVVAGMGVAAGLQVERLRAGPVRELAAESATVGVRLKVEADPSVRQSPGSRRPPYVVLKATIEEVRRGGVRPGYVRRCS
jgi:competence protein ComEC